MRTRIRRNLIASVAAAVVLALVPGTPAVASPRPAAPPRTVASVLARLAADPAGGAATAVTGAPVSDPELDRRLVQDLADFDEDQEVRDAATAVLATGDPARITDFLNNGLPVYRRAAADRKAELAADNRAQVTAWTTTGGPIARQRAADALASNDDDTVADFVAVGKAVADAADAKAAQDAAMAAATIKARVEQMVALGGYEVKSAGQAALDSEEPAIIADFYTNGFKVAAASDADAQKQITDALAARTRAVNDLADLASRSTLAATARQAIINASVAATQALTNESNAMALANRYAKQADAVYASDLPVRAAGGTTHTATLTQLAAQAHAQSAEANRLAGIVTAQANLAATAGQTLIGTGLTHGVDWTEVTAAQSAAGDAAKLAASTASSAADATAAAGKALDADHSATVDATNAVKYRTAAQSQQAAAERLATLAAKLAAAAQAAQADAHTQRLRAEADQKDAETRAQNAQDDYNRALDQRAVARASMAQAVYQERIAHDAAVAAVNQQNVAVDKGRTVQKWAQDTIHQSELFARLTDQAKDLIGRAQDSVKDYKHKEVEAEAAEAKAIEAAGGTDAARATADAQLARSAANAPKPASDKAHADARTASAAAASAAAAAHRAAAAAAAARADANAALAQAATARKDATDAAAAAGKAISDAQKANADARAAVNVAQAAIGKAAAAKADAELTRAAATSATQEAAVAAFQSRVAGRSAIDARVTAAAIADPADRAVDLASAYADTDNDAALASDVATTAMAIGIQQSAAAQQHAADADAAATHAAAEAVTAQAQVKPAYLAAQKTAEAAARAVRSSRVAIDAAIASANEANATVAAATKAANASSSASGYANAADSAAREAGSDSSVARQAANAAAGYKTQAHNAWVNAKSVSDECDKMATGAENLAAGMEKAAGDLTTLADTLTGLIKPVYDAEKAAKQQAFFIWLRDQAKNKLGGVWGGFLEGAADEVIGMGQGLYTAVMCGFGGSGAAGDEHDGLPDEPPAMPTSEEACDQIKAGIGAIFDHPGMLIHSDEWSTDWPKAAGMTLVDLLTLKIPGMGKIAGAIDAFADGLAANLARGLTEDLAAGITSFGAQAIKNALVKLGAINLSRILEITVGIPAKLTFSGDEIRAMAVAISDKGIAAVEQALRDLSDVPLIKGLKDFLSACLLHNSFAAGTLVVLGDGGHKPIDQIQPGDEVRATDPLTGTTQVEPVTALITTEDTDLADVTVEPTSGPAAVIHTTRHHLFWDDSAASWVEAGALPPGDALRVDGSGLATVGAVRPYPGDSTMFNLTVAHVHTFYVVAGTTPVLVHNDGPCKVALGNTAGNTKEWAVKNGFTHFFDFGPEEWRGPVKQMIEDSDDEIQFNLREMTGVTPADRVNYALRDFRNSDPYPYATSEELAWIGRAVYHGLRRWDSITFYDDNGAIVHIAEPDWVTALGKDFLNNPRWLDNKGLTAL